MKPYIVILQFGPVQDFILTARRTDDYWAGSFLLSFATAQVIRLLKEMGGEIIFPDPEGNALVAAVTKDDFHTDEKSLFPSLPNRLGVRISSDDVEKLKSDLSGIRGTVLKTLIYHFEKVETALTGKKTFSNDQVEDLFEFYYAVAEDDPEKFCSAFELAEERLAARKNIRDFKPFDQEGFKCTQCAIREPLWKEPSPSANRKEPLPRLKDLKVYWQEIQREKGRFRYVFKENERLCSVCAGKRLLRRACFEKGTIPSTSTIAVSAWVDRVGKRMEKEGSETLKAADDALKEFVNALQSADLWSPSPVPANREKQHSIYKIEGDCFIEDAYDRFVKEAGEENSQAGVAEIEKAREKLKAFLKSLPNELRTPPKYFTILSFDGDNMGAYKRTLKTCGDHQSFSRQLAGFTETVYRIVHQEYHGYVIYSGGDEGVALVPLSDTLAVMADLRKAFGQLEGEPTLSVGAAVVHHQAPLGAGLRAAGDALKHAKEVPGKNAFSFCIRKRSGAHMICRSPWTVKTDRGPREMADFLQKWENAYRDGLSRRWFHRMYSDLPVMRLEEGPYDQAMAKNIFYHLLPRQSPSGKGSLGLRLAKETQQVMDAHVEHEGSLFFEFHKIDNLLSLLYVPIYIFEGGKD